MSYSDFVICKEHKFLRNIFSEEELATTSVLKDLSTYHEEKFLHISIYLQNSIHPIQEFSDCPHEELLNFCLEFCSDCVDFIEIKKTISDVDMKNNPRSKISKRILQLYAYVYQKIIDFPRVKFDYETLTTYDMFVYVHRIINVKIHLHHSHVTGKILGYAHDFCNEKVRENKDVFSCVAHNFFGFDFYFLIKSIRILVWDTKQIHIGGTGLTDINFGNILEMKLTDTMKYFLTSLGKLA